MQLRCEKKCLVGWTGDFWIGGREGVGWSKGGRTILHVVDHQEEEIRSIKSSMYVSKAAIKHEYNLIRLGSKWKVWSKR